MATLVALHKKPANAAAFDAYDVSIHVPIAKKVPDFPLIGSLIIYLYPIECSRLMEINLRHERVIFDKSYGLKASPASE